MTAPCCTSGQAPADTLAEALSDSSVWGRSDSPGTGPTNIFSDTQKKLQNQKKIHLFLFLLLDVPALVVGIVLTRAGDRSPHLESKEY